MAQNDNSPSKLPADQVQEPNTYEVFQPASNPEKALPSGGADAGADANTKRKPTGNMPRPTLKDGLETIKTEDFLKVHQMPCAREGLLTGIGAGAITGAGRYIAGARAPKAANWAFGAFFIGSIIQWEYCQAQRRKERAAMARAVEVMNQKKVEQRAKEAEEARLRRQQEAEEQARKSKSWYKFW